MPEVKPGDIKRQLPAGPPEAGESMEAIFRDFREVIMPGMTHWQSPNFFGYFPANNSMPSVLGEMLTATLGAQCMNWLTSPAATELEDRVMEWLRRLTGLPETFSGVIQDTASTATLCALLVARERASAYQINQSGFRGNEGFTVYCSEQAHSSVDKAVKISGLGIDNLRKISVDDRYALCPGQLRERIQEDIRNGKRPLAAVSALGTTASTAMDPVKAIGVICEEFGLWHHIDAAYAGSSLILPEKRHLADGVETADSFVFNPHKWLFTNFDCSAFFVKDPNGLVRAFTETPEYLKTDVDGDVKNYRDWGVQLGRRFRALKLWFVLRSYGAEGLRRKLREHLALAKWFQKQVEQSAAFELMAPVELNAVCFRYNPGNIPAGKINELNETLLKKINQTGKIFMSHAGLNGNYTLRFVPGQTEVAEKHVREAWKLIQAKAKEIKLIL